MLDVRSPEEYARGHLAAARSAPGGQLVQATDVYMATRNARIVLVDDDGVRAAMTGSWLVQMGWPEVYVLDGGLAGRQLVQGTAAATVPEVERAKVATIAPAELKALLDRGEAAVIDLAPSIAYEAGHIPGAWFAVRARLPHSLDRMSQRPVLVLTSPDGRLARLAAADLDGEARVLTGGTDAWRAAGLPAPARASAICAGRSSWCTSSSARAMSGSAFRDRPAASGRPGRTRTCDNAVMSGAPG